MQVVIYVSEKDKVQLDRLRDILRSRGSSLASWFSEMMEKEVNGQAQVIDQVLARCQHPRVKDKPCNWALCPLVDKTLFASGQKKEFEKRASEKCLFRLKVDMEGPGNGQETKADQV